MRSRLNRSVLFSSILALVLVLIVLAQDSGFSYTTLASTNVAEVPAPGPFSPSNARTEDRKLIPSEQFFPAKRCAKCHQDTHAAWSESLHRNAGRAPFYKESVDILDRTRGSEPTQHCESCHAPVSVFSGALLKGSKESRAMDDEGVTCSVCHSITEARLNGTGSYTIARPALLAKEDGTPVYGDVPDSAIMADIPGHRRAVMRPLLKTPEFCGTCHKSAVTVPLNNYKLLRGFSAYDEWQQSAASRETVAPFYRKEKRVECNDCHMPRVDARNDVSAKNGSITSHRWVGANTLTPLFYGQTKQVELTKRFLEDRVLSVDVFALKNERTAEMFPTLSATQDNRVALIPGDQVTVEVVVFNQKAAHSFPPELRDMYEPWVEFEAITANGERIFHSGYLEANGTLDESAHVYKSILLDASGRVITRHQVWLAKVKAYDNAIPPGRSDVVHYRFSIPKETDPNQLKHVTLRARVHYRRFIQEYTDYVLKRANARHLEIPIVKMAESEVTIVTDNNKRNRTQAKQKTQAIPPQALARRWNDYGIGLLEQAQYGPAFDAFTRASELDSTNPDLLINAGIAQLRTERYGLEREQLSKASSLLDAALKLAPTLARARYYKALILRGQGRMGEAADLLATISGEYPRDREVQRQLGQTLYSLGRISDARTAFEALLGIDPNDHGAYQFLSPIYSSLGREREAESAHALYLLWRDDPIADVVAERFFKAHPEWAEERIGAHTHAFNSRPRPTLTGRFASPDR
jgi:tetratricopeptide (TPR) repeat protein